MLERVLGVDDYDAATREQPRRKTAVVAMIGPELNLDWIDGGHPVQLAVDSGGFVRGGLDRNRLGVPKADGNRRCRPRVPRVFPFTRRGPDSAELRSEVHLRRHTKHERTPRGNGALLNLVYVYLVNRLGRRPGRPAKCKKPAGEIARQAFHGD